MKNNLTKDSIIWPDLRIFQKRSGYRFSMDSVILPRLIKTSKNDDILEIGSGCGVMLFIISRLNLFRKMMGVEIQKDLFLLSLKNRDINKTDKIDFIHCDIKKYHETEKLKFDIIISNPPYFKMGSGRLSKIDEEITARHESKLTLHELIDSAGKLLKPRGSLYLIYSAQRQAELLCKMKELGLEPKLLIPIYPKTGSNADLIWVKGVNKAKSGLKLLPPIFMYDDKNRQTETFKKFYLPTNKELKLVYPEVY